MPIMLSPVVDGIYPTTTVGTVQTLAQALYDELIMSGYSLTIEDVQLVVNCEAKYYSGWASFETQYTAVAAIPLDLTLPIDAYEWSFLEPLCRAHCDLLQAQRVEGSRSLGGEQFGLQVSEAKQLYDVEREKLPKLAFIAPPYTLGE